MNFKSAFTPLAMILACAGPLAAQETVGTLVGTLTNQANGKPLPGVKLILRSSKMLGDRQAVTGADGSYRIALLPYGEYTLVTSAEGFNNSTVRFTVTPGQTTRQNMRLAAVQSVVVEVMADSAAQIDKTETSVQTMFPMETLSALTGGDLMRIMELAPAVGSGGTENGGTITVRGGNTTGARFLINGLDASDPGWGTFTAKNMMVTDMVETVAVVSSPLNARYGNTESGMLSFVTNRGSNEFKGSLRTTYSVNGTYGSTPLNLDWWANNIYNQDPRWGAKDTHWRTPLGDGAANRNWEATVSGPIWKDHITFAWGGRFYPSTSTQSQLTKDWIPDSRNWSSSQGGTIMPLGGGAQVRRVDTYDMGRTFDSSASTSFNQYALFWQINNSHSLDWSYSDYNEESTGMADGGIDLSSANYSTTKNVNRIWNLAYKGLIGPGVLEVRAGRSTYETIRPDTTDPKYTQISVTSTQTWFNNGFDHKVTGKPYADLGSYGATTVEYPYASFFQARNMGPYQTSFNINGSPYDKGESKVNTSLNANYSVAIGEHLLDAGVNYVKTHWDTAIGDSATKIYGTGGQIASDLTNDQILYPTGYTGPRLNASDYAGKWVVWDAHASTLGLYPEYTGSTPASTANLNGLNAPTMVKYYGQEGGGFDEATTSLYVNDIWQATNKITLMGGLRYDAFKLEDTVSKVLSYGILSPRFEVKYDIAGDQKRVLSYSWAKFHNRMPSAAFLALVHRRKPYSITTQWDTGKMGVDASGNPLAGGYRLVTTAELLDPSNYTYYTAQNNPDIYKLDPNFKADFNVEQTLSMHRAYDNGSNWRASIVYRKWFNNYQWFMDPHASYITNPYTPTSTSTTTLAKEEDPTWTTHRVLRNDSGLFHTYHSFEMEWNFVLSKRATFSGNYTYSRNHSNQMYYAAQSNYSQDNVGVRHAPWGINLPDVWKLVGLNLDDIAQKSVVRNQLANAWVSYDLSRGSLKQSLVFRARWDQGASYTNFAYATTIDPRSDAWKAILAKANVASDFPTWRNISQNYGGRMYIPYPGTCIGDDKNPDDITYNMKYNLDVPLYNRLHWWVGVEVFNVFNHRYTRNQVNYVNSNIGSDEVNRSAEFRVDGSRTGATPAANGFRMTNGDLRYAGPDVVEGGRYFQIETGIRF